MKSWITLLIFVVVLIAVAFAAPSEGSSGAPGVQLETAPATAMRVRVAGARFSPLAASEDGTRAGCTDSSCYSLCIALGWSGGFCLDADWCLCYR